jgi:large subunit ribosomal protein L4
MKATPLSAAVAAQKLNVELITNGIGTQAVHETVVATRANRRAGTHSTLTKATVNRSGKKPWRQKGTGNARAGYASSPVWRGGGVVFGPHPRDYSKKTSKKVKQLALKKVLSARVLDGEVFILESLNLTTPKTAELIKELNSIVGEGDTALLVLEKADKNVFLAARNNPMLETTTSEYVNVEQLLRCDKVLVAEAAFGKLSERLKD